MAYKGKHEAPSGAPSHKSRHSAPSHEAYSRPARSPQPQRSARPAAQPPRSAQSARPVNTSAYQPPRRKKKKRGPNLRGIIHVAAIIGLLIVGFLMVRHLWWDKRSDKLNEELQQAVEINSPAVSAAPSAKPVASATPKPSATPAPSATPEPTPSPTPTPEPTPSPEVAPIKVDFDKLKKENKDVIGWLYCEDTKVNYAIVWREGDNEYYLDHLFNGEQNEKGTVFADKRNKTPFEEWNTVLYGHNMKDDSMFGIIDEYGQQEFYDEHPIMYIITPEKDYKVEICCSFLTGLESTTFEFPRTEGNPAKTIDDIEKYSYIDTGIVPTLEDKLVSFSTCYEEDDHRYVVIGVLRELERLE